MNVNQLYELTKKLGCDVYLNEPMFKHSSFKIGGLADIFIRPYNISQLKSVVDYCQKLSITYIVVGNGSNILFRDEGIRGAVINISGKMQDIHIEDGVDIVVSAGTPLSKLAYFAMENSLTGLEFVWGIPGNVGGAVFMNAGAYGSEIKDVIVYSSYLDINGNEGLIFKDEMELGYRHSVFCNNGCIVTKARFRLSLGEKGQIKSKMDEFMAKRKSKQPLEFPNIGSIFKRPKDNYVGALIDKCGLKGLSVGGAKVSEKHSGFIVNTGGATAHDVINLISMIRQEVLNKTGYDLEPEIKIF